MAKRTKRDIPITIARGTLEDVGTDTLALGIPSDMRQLTRELRPLDQRLGKVISRTIAQGSFRGKTGETFSIAPDDAKIKRIVLVGVGARERFDAEVLRRTAAVAARRAARIGGKALTLAFPARRELAGAEHARAIAEGVAMGAYRFDEYRSEDPAKPTITRAAILVPGAESGVTQAVRRGRFSAAAANFARDLSNTPPNDLTPATLATAARRMARSRELTCTVLNKAQLTTKGMRALLAVGQGSANDPRFIHVVYEPKGRARRTVALVGKGITFDTGGISLKPWNGMWDMKFDKCGATAVLGAVRAAADMALPIRVHAIVAAAENMPSSTAYRPGDVVTTMSGKTVEIRSTDAEGRMILADALHYASQRKPDAIIDLATLTGACVVALGHHAAGLFANDDRLAEDLARAGAASGELLWRLPIHRDYRKRLDSHVADMKNGGGRPAGASVAAAFLQEYVGKGIPWAHLDIAGMSDTSTTGGYQMPGATGFGVRLLARYLENLSLKK